MQRRRIVAAAAMITAAGTAVALTVPSFAGTTARPVVAKVPVGGVAPQLLLAMQRDLGVGDDQARVLLKRSTWASGVTSTLRAQTGDAFAGSWLSTDGKTLNVAVTDWDMMGAVRAMGAQPKIVPHSEDELDQVKQTLDTVATNSDRSLPGWYVDPATNEVVILANDGEAPMAQSLVKKAGLPEDVVRVQMTTAQPKPLADVRGADPYFVQVGGRQGRCSIGFAVEGGFITAGHCGAKGTKTRSADGRTQGQVVASVFPGKADMGVVEVNDNQTPRPVVNDFEGNELSVAGSKESPVGAAVCRSGSTTGTFCGRIIAKNQTVNYPEGAVTGLTRTNVCAEGGDSGGPWLSGDQAQGVTSGGSGNCTVGGETFFQPVNEILAANNRTLLTQGGGENGDENDGDENDGENETETENDGDAETDCAALAAVRKGTMTRSGQTQAQPNGGAFRAAAGRQVACLDAPDNTEMELLLQQFSGGRFKTVAQATGTDDKTLSFNGVAGTYRYVVVATRGSGQYTLSFDVQ